MMHAANAKRPASRSGFTLIELSIVLVIIGLLAGGILAGRDLIKAAQVRAAVAQMERYQTAVGTFRTKYNALPGDMKKSDAASLGFIARGGGAGDGDGDGRIGWLGPTYPILAALGGETVFFWTDLSSAGLVEGAFNDSTDALISFFVPTDLSRYVPVSKLGAQTYIFAFSENNFWGGAPFNFVANVVFQIAHPTAAPLGQVNTIASLTTGEAYAFDSKMDDGLPNSGRVRSAAPGQGAGFGSSLGGIDIGPYAPPVSGQCMNLTSNPVQYNLASADNINCSLLVNAGF